MEPAKINVSEITAKASSKKKILLPISTRREYTVLDVYNPSICLVPCKFDKILVVGYFTEQNFILNILVLEITSRIFF